MRARQCQKMETFEYEGMPPEERMCPKRAERLYAFPDSRKVLAMCERHGVPPRPDSPLREITEAEAAMIEVMES